MNFCSARGEICEECEREEVTVIIRVQVTKFAWRALGVNSNKQSLIDHHGHNDVFEDLQVISPTNCSTLFNTACSMDVIIVNTQISNIYHSLDSVDNLQVIIE